MIKKIMDNGYINNYIVINIKNYICNNKIYMIHLHNLQINTMNIYNWINKNGSINLIK